MKVVLLNDNPAVSRLVKLSFAKMGYELDEFASAQEATQTYDLVICDSDVLDESADYSQFAPRSLFLIPRNYAGKREGRNVLEKPFLPTDFIGLVEKIMRVDDSAKDEMTVIEEDGETFTDLDSNLNVETPLEVDETPEELGESEPKNESAELEIPEIEELEEVKITDKNPELDVLNVAMNELETKEDFAELPEMEMPEDLPSEDAHTEEAELEDEMNIDENLVAVEDGEESEEEREERLNNKEAELSELSAMIDEIDSNEATASVETAESASVEEAVGGAADELAEDLEESKINEEMLEVGENNSNLNEEEILSEDVTSSEEAVEETREDSNLDEEIPSEEVSGEPAQTIEEEAQAEEIAEEEVAEELPSEEEITSEEVASEEIAEVEPQVDDSNLNEETSSEEEPNESSDLDSISETEVMGALGEEVPEEFKVAEETADSNLNGVAAGDEATQSNLEDELKSQIAQEVSDKITAALSEGALKDVLKTMNIKINVSFEDK